jgi:DNA-binding IclR family transcriptional regulator/rubrerythrin
MPRASNPTGRVVAILDFLAARPERPYGLSELARSLGINKATCLTVLGGLVQAGYLLQDPEAKTYTLGPSSLALGNAALVRFPAVGPARAVMEALAEELGVVCTVMVRANNNLVVLTEAGTPGPLRATVSRVGLRTPFIPPLGATFIAWATPTEFESWMARAQPALADSERTELRRVVATIRARGFHVTQLAAGETTPIREYELAAAVDPEKTLSDVVTAMARLAHDETRHVVQVSQLMGRRGQPAAYDFGDDYAAALREHIRKPEPERLLDRLLVFAVIEGRSAERLELLANALPDPKDAQLYASLATAEVRHRDIFLALARDTSPDAWRARAAELAGIEAEILTNRPIIPRIH